MIGDKKKTEHSIWQNTENKGFLNNRDEIRKNI